MSAIFIFSMCIKMYGLNIFILMVVTSRIGGFLLEVYHFPLSFFAAIVAWFMSDDVTLSALAVPVMLPSSR